MSSRKQITLSRSYDASLDDVWELWTTPSGIESWWGPEGFSTKVRKLELKPGGALLYTMTAVAPEQVAFMRNAGMPLSTDARITFAEVVPQKRLVLTNRVDFVPEVTAYDVTTQVEFKATAKGVKLVISLEAMHDAPWTQRMVAGWESQLTKFEAVIRMQPTPTPEPTMKKVTPFLWLNDGAEQAAKFYKSVFKGAEILSMRRRGQGKKASVLSVRVRIEGQELELLNGGPHYKLSPAFSLFVFCESQKEVDAYWNKLVKGGKPSRCGWLEDRFGVSWQIIPRRLNDLLWNSDPATASAAMESMLGMVKIDIAKLEKAVAAAKAKR